MKKRLEIRVPRDTYYDPQTWANSIVRHGPSAIYFHIRGSMDVVSRRAVDMLTGAEGRVKTVNDVVIQHTFRQQHGMA